MKKSILKNLAIQVLVAILTLGFMLLFPRFSTGSPSDLDSFRSAFGLLAVISYIAYFILSWVAVLVVYRFKLSNGYIYLGHLVAFLAGYFLFYGAFVSIAIYGIPIG